MSECSSVSVECYDSYTVTHVTHTPTTVTQTSEVGL